MTIYSTIITLRPTRGFGATTIQKKTDNKIMETSTSPKKYGMTDYFKCRYHLTLFKIGLVGRAGGRGGGCSPMGDLKVHPSSPTPFQKICFKYLIRLKFSIDLSYIKKIQKTWKHVPHHQNPWVLLISPFCHFVILGNTNKNCIWICFF